MTDARTLTLALGGRWHGRYGAVPCPVCQPERRRGQDALTLADGGKGLLAHCKKSACAFRDIAAAAGIAPGTFRYCNLTSGNSSGDGAASPCRGRPRQGRSILVFHGVAKPTVEIGEWTDIRIRGSRLSWNI